MNLTHFARRCVAHVRGVPADGTFTTADGAASGQRQPLQVDVRILASHAERTRGGPAASVSLTGRASNKQSCGK